MGKGVGVFGGPPAPARGNSMVERAADALRKALMALTEKELEDILWFDSRNDFSLSRYVVSELIRRLKESDDGRG